MKNDDAAPPTRRTFVALLGAAATAFAIKLSTAPPEPERPRSSTRWIGHC